MLRKVTALVFLLAWVCACEEESLDDSIREGDRGGDGSSSSDPPSKDDAGNPIDEPPDPKSDGGTVEDAGSQAPTDAAPVEDAAPACPDQGSLDLASQSKLQAWLETRTYKCWTQESKVHASTGPHGGNVKTYINDALLQSFESGSTEHPKGAIAVKELFKQSTTNVIGWAVGIKTQAASSGGAGWYWYEIIDYQTGNPDVYVGQNLAVCTNCHKKGDDFVLSPFPLQ